MPLLPVALAVSSDEPPLQMVAGSADAVTVPTAGLLTATVTCLVVVAMQPPTVAVAVTVYVVLTVGLTLIDAPVPPLLHA